MTTRHGRGDHTVGILILLFFLFPCASVVWLGIGLPLVTFVVRVMRALTLGLVPDSALAGTLVVLCAVVGVSALVNSRRK